MVKDSRVTYAANIVTQMDTHINSHLLASFNSDFHTSSISTYHPNADFVDRTSAFKARFAASRVLIEISSALVTRLSTHSKWSQLRCKVQKTVTHESNYYTNMGFVPLYIKKWYMPCDILCVSYNDLPRLQ